MNSCGTTEVKLINCFLLLEGNTGRVKSLTDLQQLSIMLIPGTPMGTYHLGKK